MTTRVGMIIETLQANPNQDFTAKQLAGMFVQRYAAELAEKRKNYPSDQALIVQLAAEIGGSRTEEAKKRYANIVTRDKPRPRLYRWQSDVTSEKKEVESAEEITGNDSQTFAEHALYPLLIQFLKEELNLYCLRINEKTSKNRYGSGGNHWLHPDVVAFAPLDQHWHSSVRDCVRSGTKNTVQLWSFEVKKQLTRANVRHYFFQAVSNSSWANAGYLVITGLDNNVESELQMLCSLHGIGVLLLNTESLFDSQILIPAKVRSEVDWLSVNRIVEENQDFQHYIEQVGIYLQTGKLTKSVWNKS